MRACCCIRAVACVRAARVVRCLPRACAVACVRAACVHAPRYACVLLRALAVARRSLRAHCCAPTAAAARCQLPPLPSAALPCVHTRTRVCMGGGRTRVYVCMCAHACVYVCLGDLWCIYMLYREVIYVCCRSNGRACCSGPQQRPLLSTARAAAVAGRCHRPMCSCNGRTPIDWIGFDQKNRKPPRSTIVPPYRIPRLAFAHSTPTRRWSDRSIDLDRNPQQILSISGRHA